MKIKDFGTASLLVHQFLTKGYKSKLGREKG
jgi:hypothetical protein